MVHKSGKQFQCVVPLPIATVDDRYAKLVEKHVTQRSSVSIKETKKKKKKKAKLQLYEKKKKKTHEISEKSIS